MSPIRGWAPGQEAGNSGSSGGGGWGPGSTGRLPGSFRPCKPPGLLSEGWDSWGGDRSQCARGRGSAKWTEQEWALRPEVVLIIYFWFIFRKLREFLYLKAAFLVLENNFLGSAKYSSSFDSLLTAGALLLQEKYYLLITWNSRFQYLTGLEFYFLKKNHSRILRCPWSLNIGVLQVIKNRTCLHDQ